MPDPHAKIDLPLPFIPEQEPTSDDYFLSLEFRPENPATEIDPTTASSTNTAYKTEGGRIVFKSPSNYDAVEIAPNYFRYTVSVPNPSFVTLDSYLSEAKEEIRNVLASPIGDCSLRVYLAGDSMYETADETGIRDWLVTSLNADSVTSKTGHENNSLVVFESTNAEPQSL